MIGALEVNTLLTNRLAMCLKSKLAVKRLQSWDNKNPVSRVVYHP